MSTTTNSKLPNEVWDGILSLLTKRDLKNLRLAGKWHIADNATPLLFDTAYVATRRGVLDVLTGLASHPILRHHVKQLIYDNSWIDPRIPGTFTDDWTEAIEAVHADTQLALAFASQEFIRTRELRPILKKCFEAFTNLRKIYCAEMARIAGLPGDNLEACSDLSSENDPKVQRVFFRQYGDKSALCCLKNVCKKKHSNFFQRQYGGLCILLSLLHENYPPSLEESSLGDAFHAAGNDAGGIPNFFLYRLSDNTFPALVYIFGYLRKLDLTICKNVTGYSGPGESPSETDSLDGLKYLLGSAGFLEDLRLNSSTGYMNLDAGWPDKALGSLRNLCLTGFQMGFERLSNIIWCNRSSLQHLQLDDVELLTENWPAVTDFCQKHAQNLTVVYGDIWCKGHRVEIAHEPAKDDDDEDSSFSDGEDFIHTKRVIGYRRKQRLAGEPETDESEYEDLTETRKELIDSSDEELEYVSDDDSE